MSRAPTTTTTARSGHQGRMFRASRQGAGLSTRALAKRAEISHTSISRWERGQRDISETTYEHLMTALADFMSGRWSE